MLTSESGWRISGNSTGKCLGQRLAQDQHTMHLAIIADGGFHNHVLPYPMLVEGLLQCLAFIQHFCSLSTVLMEFVFI